MAPLLPCSADDDELLRLWAKSTSFKVGEQLAFLLAASSESQVTEANTAERFMASADFNGTRDWMARLRGDQIHSILKERHSMNETLHHNYIPMSPTVKKKVKRV